MRPSKTPDLAKNYTLSVNMAKESLVMLHQTHQINFFGQDGANVLDYDRPPKNACYGKIEKP